MGNGLVDGFHASSKSVFQFHACKLHGCPKCLPDRETVVLQGKTVARLFPEMQWRTENTRVEGFTVLEKWEAFGDKNQRKKPTNNLVYESAHVRPTSVGVAS